MPAHQHTPNILLSYNLVGKNIMIAGGDETVGLRVDKLLHSKAKLTVICPQEDLSPEAFKAVFKHYQQGDIYYYDRRIDFAEDVDPFYDIIIVCMKNENAANRLASAAREAGISVFSTRMPESSDFSFASEFINGSLQIGVSTGGYAPAIAARVREALMPSIPVFTVQAIENVKVLRLQLINSKKSGAIDSNSLEKFENLCKTLSFQRLARLSYKEALELIGESQASVSTFSYNPITLAKNVFDAVLARNPFAAKTVVPPLAASFTETHLHALDTNVDDDTDSAISVSPTTEKPAGSRYNPFTIASNAASTVYYYTFFSKPIAPAQMRQSRKGKSNYATRMPKKQGILTTLNPLTMPYRLGSQVYSIVFTQKHAESTQKHINRQLMKKSKAGSSSDATKSATWSETIYTYVPPPSKWSVSAAYNSIPTVGQVASIPFIVASTVKDSVVERAASAVEAVQEISAVKATISGVQSRYESGLDKLEKSVAWGRCGVNRAVDVVLPRFVQKPAHRLVGFLLG